LTKKEAFGRGKVKTVHTEKRFDKKTRHRYSELIYNNPTIIQDTLEVRRDIKVYYNPMPLLFLAANSVKYLLKSISDPVGDGLRTVQVIEYLPQELQAVLLGGLFSVSETPMRANRTNFLVIGVQDEDQNHYGYYSCGLDKKLFSQVPLGKLREFMYQIFKKEMCLNIKTHHISRLSILAESEKINFL